MRETTSLRALLLAATVIAAGCSDAGPTATQPSRPNAAAAVSTPQLDQTKTKQAAHIVTATGDITGAVNEYRALLGTLNPNVVGEQLGGRREINWDGVPAAFTNNDLFPGNFFNVNSPRGVVFTTDGSGFRISSNGYVDVNPHYEGEFLAFSPQKLFVARGSTIIDVHFFVAGSNTPALVTGFGSVFEDVGRAKSTTIEYFDAAGKRLLKLAVPRRSDAGGQSFAGAAFGVGIVASVRITVGDTPIDLGVFDNVKGAGHKTDIVTTDDFIYGEPRASQ